MVRVGLILMLIFGAGAVDGGPPQPPSDPGLEEVLSDPEWVVFLENLEMLDEYGDLIDVETPEPIPAKPDGPSGVNTGGDGGEDEKK
jgi:hypothetical protein